MDSPHGRILCAALVLLAAAGLAWAQDGEGEGEGDSTNPAGMLLELSGPSAYMPGEISVVKIVIDANDAEGITALGATLALPPGWTYEGILERSGALPAVAPQPGDEGEVSFAWIQVPDLPLSFDVELGVPGLESERRELTGVFTYRTMGPAFESNTAMLTFAGPDDAPPVITLEGDNPLVWEQGIIYVEPGFTATDNGDGDLTEEVIVYGFVNDTIPGEYVLTYEVFDHLNLRGETTRTVIVLPSPKGPFFCGVAAPTDGASGWGDAAVLLGAALVLASGRRGPVSRVRQRLGHRQD